MEALVGDEVVNMEHFDESMKYVLEKGVVEGKSDTEESEDDTDEDEQQQHD
jgi:hypothetical protein